MKQRFGTRLQEKTLWDFYVSRLRQNGLWRLTDRIASFLSRYLWVRRFWQLLLFALTFLEKSLLFVALSSLCLLLLPILILLLSLDRLIHLYRDCRYDRILLQENGPLLLWSCSYSNVLENAPLLHRILTATHHPKEKVILILPNTVNAPRIQKVTQGKQTFWLTRPAYFYHLRRRLQKNPHILCTIVYE